MSYQMLYLSQQVGVSLPSSLWTVITLFSATVLNERLPADDMLCSSCVSPDSKLEKTLLVDIE